jgi:hypothetical protein
MNGSSTKIAMWQRKKSDGTFLPEWHLFLLWLSEVLMVQASQLPAENLSEVTYG